MFAALKMRFRLHENELIRAMLISLLKDKHVSGVSVMKLNMDT